KGSSSGKLLGMVRIIFFAIALLATSCSKPPDIKAFSPAKQKEQTYQAQGIVLEVKAKEKTVRIRHQEVVGYMPAMTMPFDVKDANELAGLAPGDSVSF